MSKILFVDDDELLSEFAVMMLENAGHEICYCESGETAIEQIEEFAPKLVLLDMLMPGMNGLQTCDAIKKIPSSTNTPILFLSGKTDEESQKSFREAGAVGLIEKPFDPEKLDAKIQELLEQ